MRITVKYFAALSEFAGTSQETIEIEHNSIRQLYKELQDKYKFPYEFDTIKTAINTEYVSEDITLQENDTIVFVTPVAGG